MSHDHLQLQLDFDDQPEIPQEIGRLLVDRRDQQIFNEMMVLHPAGNVPTASLTSRQKDENEAIHIAEERERSRF